MPPPIETSATGRGVPGGLDVAALTMGTAGIGIAALPPAAPAALGCCLYLAGATLRPWITIPVVVLTLPFYLHPRSFGGFEISFTEIAILLGAVALGLRSLVAQGIVPGAPKAGSASAQGRLLAPPSAEIPLSLTLPRQGGGDAIRGRPKQVESAYEGGRDPPEADAPSVDWAVAAFLLAALLSLLVTEYPKQSLRELRWLVLEPILLLYVARFTLTTPGRITVVLWSVVAAGTVAAVVAIAGLATSGELADPVVRAAAPYLSANHLGLFLGRAGAVALALALFGTGQKLLGGAALVPIGWALLRSLSFGAWLGFAGAALALAALRGRRWLLVAALGCVTTGFVAVTLLPAERTLERLDPTAGTAASRLHVWSSSLRMLADHPLLGIGLDNYLYLYRTTYIAPDAWREPNISHPHNFVLHFWLQLGVLGLVAGLAVMAWTLATAHQLFQHPTLPTDRVVAAATVALLVDFVVHGSFDNSYFLVDTAVLWWLGVALLSARVHRRPPSQAITTAVSIQ